MSWVGRAILFEMRIARTRSSYEYCRGQVTREGEVGGVSGFCVERALRQHACLSVVGLAAISKVPFARDDHCEPIIAVRMCSDVRMRRYLELDGIWAGLGRIAGQHNCLNSFDSRGSCAGAASRQGANVDNTESARVDGAVGGQEIHNG